MNSSREISAPKFPDAHVQLSGEDGNVFSIIGRTLRALRAAGATDAEREAFISEMQSGDYDHALQTVMRWVETS